MTKITEKYSRKSHLIADAAQIGGNTPTISQTVWANITCLSSETYSSWKMDTYMPKQRAIETLSSIRYIYGLYATSL